MQLSQGSRGEEGGSNEGLVSERGGEERGGEERGGEERGGEEKRRRGEPAIVLGWSPSADASSDARSEGSADSCHWRGVTEEGVM